MLDPLLNLVSPARRARARHAPLVSWGEARGLTFEAGRDGRCSLTGQWQGGAVRIDVQPASRPYLAGWELSARTDLGLAVPTGIVLLDRSLKQSLERWADYLYSQLTNSLQTVADTLPEEVRWLATYRDAGWPGPDPAFFERYAVLTDASDEARLLVDAAAIHALMQRPVGDGVAGAPFLLMRLRGKLQLRLQLAAEGQVGIEMQALDLFESMSLRLRAQTAEISSRG
ncbi:hypothetical protein ACLIJR_05875 [Hydrogenophaga sp. XSHU_21]